MLNLGGILTVILASLVTSKHGSPLQNKDIEDFVKILKGRQSHSVMKLPIESSSDSNSNVDSVNDSIYGLLKNMEVIDLIEKANEEKSTSKSKKRNKNRFQNYNSNPVYRNYVINRHKDGTQQILEHTAHLERQKLQSLTSNNLLSLNTFKNDVEQEVTYDDDGLNEYSKLFVILNPVAIQKSKNKATLTNLVSRILSLSSASNEKAHQERNKSHRYKGFKVKNNLFSRRYRRDSEETFGGRDSAEDDYKQKRSRNDHNGGSGGGRTAIPYIRQRGEIYERDH